MKPDPSVTPYTALVIGAAGVIGKNLIDYLMTLPEWDIIGVSRRGGKDAPGLRYISADLLNEADTRAKLQDLTTVTLRIGYGDLEPHTMPRSLSKKRF